MKKLQITGGLALILLGSSASTLVPSTPELESVKISELQKGKENPISVGFWVILVGIFTLSAGISGKMITSRCLKHGEVITKIRV